MSQFETTKLHPIQESGNEAQDILLYVYNALQAKGYDPITQLVGYIISTLPVIRPSSPDRWFSPRPSRRCIC